MIATLPRQAAAVLQQNGRFVKEYWSFLTALTHNANLAATSVAPVVASTWVASGTNADRLLLPASSVQDGSLYIETDTGLVYQARSSSWVYLSGTMQAVQSDLVTLAATLGSNDTGLLVEVTDFRHILRWNGAGFEWGPGEDGRHDLVSFDTLSPSPTTGWQQANGSATTYLKSDGTTGAHTVASLVNFWFRR